MGSGMISMLLPRVETSSLPRVAATAPTTTRRPLPSALVWSGSCRYFDDLRPVHGEDAGEGVRPPPSIPPPRSSTTIAPSFRPSSQSPASSRALSTNSLTTTAVNWSRDVPALRWRPSIVLNAVQS